MSEEQEKPIVVFIWREGGDIDFHITDGVALYCVDERCKSDRVYQYTTPTARGKIMALLGDSPVGKLGDKPEKEAAILRTLRMGKLPGERGFLESIDGGVND